MNVGFIGAGNLALYMAQGFVRSGKFVSITDRYTSVSPYNSKFQVILIF